VKLCAPKSHSFWKAWAIEILPHACAGKFWPRSRLPIYLENWLVVRCLPPATRA
jgi:hypothetical protein